MSKITGSILILAGILTVITAVAPGMSHIDVHIDMGDGLLYMLVGLLFIDKGE